MSAPLANRIVANFKAAATRDKQEIPFDLISDAAEVLEAVKALK